MNVRMVMRDYYLAALESVKQDRELQVYLVLGFALLIGGGGYYGYRWHTVQLAQKAQQAYVASLDVYQQALAMQFEPHAQAQTRLSLWEQVEVDTRHAVDQYKGSSYVPFFNAFLVQSLFYQEKRDEALVTMRQVVKTMKAQQGYRGLYQVTLDLMLLDGSAEEQKQALADLELLAADEKSAVQDMALYYVGLYYSSIGDQKKALTYWKKASTLAQPYPELSSAQSPWQRLAVMKLTELGADER